MNLVLFFVPAAALSLVAVALSGLSTLGTPPARQCPVARAGAAQA